MALFSSLVEELDAKNINGLLNHFKVEFNFIYITYI